MTQTNKNNNKTNLLENSIKFQSRIHLVQKGTTDSRILEKKNIQKRLQNLSMKQYQRINKNLLKQNQKLKNEVETLSQKVKKLLQSKKYQITQNKNNHLIQSKILQTKKQLQKQYQIMNEYKQELQKQQNNNITQQIKNNMKQKKNNLIMIQKNIQELIKQKDKLLYQFKSNQEDYQEYIPTKEYIVECEKVKEQNKEYKKKINKLMLDIKDKQKISKDALTKLYNLKKENQYLKQSSTAVPGYSASLNKKNRIKSLSILAKSQSINITAKQRKQKQRLSLNSATNNKIYSNKNLNNTKNNQSLSSIKPLHLQAKHLQEQVYELKKKKNQIQNILQSDKLIKQSAKNKIQKQIRQLLEYHKQLFKRRVRELTQLNYYQKKQSELKQKQKQSKLIQESRIKLPLVEKAMQTDNLIKKSYRKDWIGFNNDQGNSLLSFNDSQTLQFKQLSYIRSLIIYRTIDHIVFIKFGYQNSQNKRKYQSKIPFDKQLLKKIQAKRVTSKDNGYLINLTVSLTKNIITRIQTKWSDGDNLVHGWETEQSHKYKFDILDKQRPLSFYGTVMTHPKTSYALTSLGCQILQNQ